MIVLVIMVAILIVAMVSMAPRGKKPTTTAAERRERVFRATMPPKQ